jgi:hypothetical protein
MKRCSNIPAIYCLWALLIPVCAAGQTAIGTRGTCSAGSSGEVSCSAASDGVVSQGGPAPGPIQIGIFSTGGIGMRLQGEAEIVRKEPYLAEAVTEVRQTLANGTHITQTIRAKVARDSEGRTLRSQKLNGNGPFLSIFRGDPNSASAPAPAEVPTLTTIFDPIAREHIDYTSDQKIARVLPVDISSPESEKTTRPFVLQQAGPGATLLPGDPGQVIAAGPLPMAMHPMNWNQQTKKQSLGSRTIEGIEAVGTRTTWTIPIGAIGNDKALVTTEETWYSPELKLVLLSIRDDPRVGETIYSLKDIERTEPDKSLFQVPAGYDVEKIPPPPIMPPPTPRTARAPR